MVKTPPVPIPIRTYDLIERLLKERRLEHGPEGRNALKRLATFRDKALRRLARPPEDAKAKEFRKLRDEADELASTWVRTRYTKDMGGPERMGYCFTCKDPKLLPYSKLQNGHWIRRKHWGVRWHEYNLHPQCEWCNDPKRGGGQEAQHEARIAAVHGSQWPDRLRALAKFKAKKPSVLELLYIVRDLKSKIEGLKNG